MPLLALLTSKETAIALALVFSLAVVPNQQTNQSIDVNKMVLRVENHKVFRDGIEYTLILDTEGEKKKGKFKIRPSKNEINIQLKKAI